MSRKCVTFFCLSVETDETAEVPSEKENRTMKASTKSAAKPLTRVYMTKSVSSLKHGGLIKKKIREWKDTFLIRGASRA